MRRIAGLFPRYLLPGKQRAVFSSPQQGTFVRFCSSSSAAASSSASKGGASDVSSSSPASQQPAPPPAYKSSRVGSGQSRQKEPPSASVSCAEDTGPVEKRKLTALQKRQLAMKDKMAFKLTPNAVYRVKVLLNNYAAAHPAAAADEQPEGIRIGVKKRGCSGYSYTVNYEFKNGSEKKPMDTKVDQSGVNIFVDGDALFYVIGTEMDFTISNVEEKFTFQNPNQKHSCGCGESFMPFDV